MTTAVLTIVSVPGILALVNLAKHLGLTGPWSALLAVILGVALALTAYLLAGTGTWQAIQQGLILGLSAAGLYDLTGTTKTTATTE